MGTSVTIIIIALYLLTCKCRSIDLLTWKYEHDWLVIHGMFITKRAYVRIKSIERLIQLFRNQMLAIMSNTKTK